MFSMVLVCAAFSQFAENETPRTWTSIIFWKAQPATAAQKTDWLAYFKSHGPRVYSHTKTEPVGNSRITYVPVFPYNPQMTWAVPAYGPMHGTRNPQPDRTPAAFPAIGSSEIPAANTPPTPKK